MQKVISIATALLLVSAAQFLPQNMHKHGHGHTQHDEVNMPGLKGEDATPEESQELAVMFRNFQDIDRTVENLPNGIKTITTSKNAHAFQALVNHVTGMINRVEEKRDPKIFIQSPTLDIFFERSEAITTEIEVTEDSVIVTQTSDDPELVEAMHKHAHEVSRMVEHGMRAVHEMMMERSKG